MTSSSPHILPDDVWDAIGISGNISIKEETKSLVDSIMYWHGSPRNKNLIYEYCKSLPISRIFICGAGTLTRSLLAELPAGIVVVGIIDRMAAEIDEFCGCRVVTPSVAARMDFDYVLLAHNVFEMEMSQALIAAGIPASRIVAVHTDPRYHALAAPIVAEMAATASRRPVDAVVISCASAAIISDRQLLESMTADRTVHLFIGRGDGELNADQPYETFNLMESMTALRAALLRLRPRVIYVKSIIYRNYIGILVKHWLPESIVLQEFYDFNVLWPDEDLERLFGLNSTSIDWLRRAEWIAGETLDFVISKRGGSAWRSVWGRRPVPYRMIFPQVVASPAESILNNQTPFIGDLVYAGFLPAPSFLRTFPIGYNFLPLLEELCAEGGLTTDIFNGSHNSDVSGDAIFAEYLQRYGNPPLRYHSRLPYGDLLRRLQGYRFGWLCNDQQTFHGDREVGVCNRWTGYVSAGLPTILDGSWSFMGELVKEYKAGIVIENVAAEPILTALARADRGAMARGVSHLRTHLLARNAAASADIATTISQGLG